ncbi:hypothetical protein [Paraburkholderia sp. J94]|uniref:hypothetical protein n=1 Tax=Paraburkholderia sp. J94 TaxID=2805441 RepID=UPI002AB308D9|nr:hypothetical protein [Paraburkholderia sp. J94]
MPDLYRRRAWVGSLAFTAVSSLVVFLLFGLPSLSGTDHLKVAQVVIFSLAAALGLEGARRLKLAQLRNNMARSSTSHVMTVEINGVRVGEVSEAAYAEMRMACANDPRNYVLALQDLVGVLLRNAGYTALVMATFLGLYALACCLFAPTGFALAVGTCVSFVVTNSANAPALGTVLHALAQALVNCFALVYLLLTGSRMAFAPSLSVLQPFRNDLYRRIRRTLCVAASGSVLIHRTSAF